MAHDGEYFRKRATEAWAAAICREEGEDLEIAGQLALAYSALARRKTKKAAVASPTESEKLDA
ncbi:MAG: hypothetical protein ACLGHC_02385 [Alphaproteobacteria bacterium]